ncbi:MAG TPA: ABC transporter ATP-binding protein [Anaeromyxobacteraceae bacterium]|nr:ABC transporter ATP-binding protein [Anaeromyxobacteraceae bacterium]
MGVVELENVWKIYDNGFEAVKGLSATLQDGEFISVLGPSGCGKTSTLRMIAGLEEISRGEIRIDGIRVNELLPGDRNVAMAFESYALYPHLTVFENIAYPLRVRHLPEVEIERQVGAICDALGIAAYRSLRPASLSGGAQQRTGLARALVRSASIFLLDEVLSHLDAGERAMLRGEIRRVQKLMRLTALFVTHDQLEALAMSDRIAVMNDGELQQIGTPEEIYDAPANLFVAGFVGEPAMNTLRAERVQEGGRDQLRIGGQNLSARDLGLRALPAARELTLGIRPKNVTLRPAGEPGTLAGRVHTFEMLGDFTLASIDLGSGHLAFKIGEAGLRLALDEPVAVSFEPEKVHFFDAETSLRIRPGAGPG